MDFLGSDKVAFMDNFAFTELLDLMTDGITVQDLDFNIIYQNRTMQDAFGGHLGEKCYAVYERRDKICEECGLQKAFQTREANMVLRTGVLISGQLTSWENSCSPLFDKEGKVIAGMEICRNVTSRVSLEAEVRERNNQLGQMIDQLERQTAALQEALRQREIMAESLKQETERRAHLENELRQAQKLEAIGQLAAGIAHEINTPTQYVGDNTRFLQDAFERIVAILQAYNELLRAAKEDRVTPEGLARVEDELAADDLTDLFEQIPEAIRDTLEGIERITKIVRAMKEFSHPGEKAKTLADLNKAIESTITVTRNEWKYIADLELDLDPNLPLVPCFIVEINQCILNLVVNAAHAIEDLAQSKPGFKGKIAVRTRRDANHVEVRVEDNGTGIPEDIRHRVFEPFFTTKDIGRGSGQGLSIVYGIIVKKHGGAMTFETEVGEGTAFVLRLPISQTSAPEAGSLT